jgi:hypothetical protein
MCYILYLQILVFANHGLFATGKHSKKGFIIVVINVCICVKFCHCLLQTVGIRVPVRNSGDFPLFPVGFLCKCCPSVTCASTTNTIYTDIDIFIKQLVTHQSYGVSSLLLVFIVV